uniref:ORF1a n=1 Tax=Simian hemorrhagic fever virus TaxID=38143 RepID=L0CQD3_SHFV|nr:ORF1a [Simian hemorrhagic fever virus]
MLCECQLTMPVGLLSRRVVCLMCGCARRPQPTPQQIVAKYGPLSQYVDASIAHIYSGLGNNTCSLELLTVCALESGTSNHPHDLELKIREVCHAGGVGPTNYRRYLPGFLGFVKVFGPVYGAVAYVSPLHCSRDFFEGATHAIVRPSIYRGPERVEERFPYNFELGGSMYQYGTNTITETENCVMWTPGVTPGVAMAGVDCIEFADAVVKTFPASFVAYKTWLGSIGNSLRVECQDYSGLSFEHGDCWTQLFPNPLNEKRIAQTFGYQLTVGVQGKYLSRRAQTNGIKFVHNSTGPFNVLTFHKGSWLGHVQEAHKPIPEGMHLLARISVVPYNEYSPLPLFKFPGKVWFGGNARSKTVGPDTPISIDPNLPGLCWLHVLPPLARTEEAQRAMLALQLTTDGVTGTYLNWRLLQNHLQLEEHPGGPYHIYQNRFDPTQRHITCGRTDRRDLIFVASVAVMPLDYCRETFQLGFGVRYGKRKRKGGGIATIDLSQDWDKSIKAQEASMAQQPHASPPLTFGAPDPATEPLKPNPAIRDVLCKKSTSRGRGARVQRKPTLPAETFVPPPDGACGVHCVAAIQHHVINNCWPDQPPKVSWGVQEWSDTDTLGEFLIETGTPAAISPCDHARYVIRLVDNHFVVDHYPNRPISLVPMCCRGFCVSVEGDVPGIVKTECSYNISGSYSLLGRFQSATEFFTTVTNIIKCSISDKELLTIVDRVAASPASVPSSYVTKVTPTTEADLIQFSKPTPRPRKRKAPLAADLTTVSVSEPKNQSCPPPPAQPQDLSTAQPAQAEKDNCPPAAPVGVKGAPPRFRSKFKSLGDKVRCSAAQVLSMMADPHRGVFGLLPHILAFFHCQSRPVSLWRLLVAYFCVLAALVFTYQRSAIAIIFMAVPLLANPHSAKTRVTSVACLCIFVLSLFLGAERPVCESDDDTCLRAIDQLRDRFANPPPVYVTPGILTAGLALLRNFIVTGAASAYLHFFLLALDILVILALMFLNGVCFRCFGRCIRTAPNEVHLCTVPASRVSRSTLLDICDTFSAPPIDVIRMATGYAGCYQGCINPTGASANIECARIDPKKVTPSTCASFPSCASEASKAIIVLSARGTIGPFNNAKVEKVDKLPFKNPIFPYDVNNKKVVVVDPTTYTLFSELGCDISHLVIGAGDFFKVMNTPRPDAFTVMKLKATRRLGGGVVPRAALAIIYVICCVCLGVYFQSPVQCGITTSDPFCKSSFGVPIIQSQGVCRGDICLSPLGVSRSLSSLIELPSVAPYIVVLFLLVFTLWYHFPTMVEAGVVLAVALLPNTQIFNLLRVGLAFTCIPFVSIKVLAFHVCTTMLLSPLCSFVIVVAFTVAWYVGAQTGTLGLVTPYDIRRVVKSPRDSVAVANAPLNTYLGAVRRAALTGKPVMFVADNTGFTFEGAFRNSSSAPNSASVHGAASGSGGLFKRNGKTICVTASHVCGSGPAVVSFGAQNYNTTFHCIGDYAEAEVNVPGSFPDFTQAPNDYVGRAYWYCANGVETGFVTPTGCIVFSGPGDSGSPITTPDGQLVGVHTGSDAAGTGAFSRPDGSLVSGGVSLSLAAQYYDGSLVELPASLPRGAIRDTQQVPATLARLLTQSLMLEGSLSTLQLLVVSAVLWKYCIQPSIIPFVVLFFLINEIAPRCIMRALFNFCLFALAILTPLAGKVFFIRLLICALNRNVTALIVHVVFGFVAFINDYLIIGNVDLALRDCSFYVMGVNHDPFIGLMIGCFVSLACIILDIFGHTKLGSIISGTGSFDPTFLARYVHEGIRQGVSTGYATESLSACLATSLSKEELAFVEQLVDCKAVVAAVNTQRALDDYILSSSAKRLRTHLSSVHASAAATKALACLEDFLIGSNKVLKAGDPVILLGSAPGTICSAYCGSQEYVVKPIRSQMVAGTLCTLCQVEVVVESGLLSTTDHNGKKYVTINGKPCFDHPQFKPENDARISKSRRDADEKKRDSDLLGTVTVSGTKYDKYWDKVTGDVWYEPVKQEGATPSVQNLTPIDVASAATMIGLSTDLSEADKRRLQVIIDKLQGLTSQQALNC